MTQPTGVALDFGAQYINTSSPGDRATGLSVTVIIMRRNGDGTETLRVASTAATESANIPGTYWYTMSSVLNDAAGIYVAEFYTTSTGVTQKPLAATQTVTTWAGLIDVAISSRPTAAVIADAVGERTVAASPPANTADALWRAGGSAGDPLANPVPGSYTTGQAGYFISLIGTANGSVQSPVTTTDTVTLYAGSTYGSSTQTVTFNSSSTIALTGTPRFEIPDLGIALSGVLTGSSGAWVMTFSFTGSETASLQLGTRRFRVRVALTGGNITPALVDGTVNVR
jgi:hypothetical protein